VEMRIALEEFLGDISYQLTTLDIDQDPALIDLYDELVPVLFARKSTLCDSSEPNSSVPGKKLCHYFLDTKKVKEFCNE
jgi:hypothetical protein